MIKNENVRYNLDRINEESNANLNLDLEQNNDVQQSDSSPFQSKGSGSKSQLVNQVPNGNKEFKFSLTNNPKLEKIK